MHYLLDHQQLTAENHILIDQLTFGDKVESPNALNLPMRLAVALLKDSQRPRSICIFRCRAR